MRIAPRVDAQKIPDLEILCQSRQDESRLPPPATDLDDVTLDRMTCDLQ